MIGIKKELYAKCVTYVRGRMEAAQHAIDEVQQAQNDDTKSSAGDKYETGREMMQQETDRHMGQLNEANKLMVALSSINPESLSSKGETGSLVVTDNGNFYIAISAGSLPLNNEAYFAVSPFSPIGLKMKGLMPGDNFKLNDKNYLIKNIF